MLKRPLIILGSVRSGTTLLGNLLKEHPDVAYWEEPKHIWRHRHAYRCHDVLTADDVTPAISRYIHAQFETYRQQNGKSRFIEKTPSNCLRVPFIRAIFPDAQFVHLVRDGRAAAVSARVQWRNDFMVAKGESDGSNTSHRQTNDKQSILENVRDAAFTVRKFLIEKRRLSGGIWSFLETPAYVPDLGRVIARKMTKDRSFIWGTRFPGIKETHHTYPLIEVCALQWAHSVQSAQMHSRDLPANQYLELRFEDLVADPTAHLQAILAFAGLNESPAMMAHARQIIQISEHWRTATTAAEIAQMEMWIGPLLTHLGYNCDTC